MGLRKKIADEPLQKLDKSRTAAKRPTMEQDFK